MLLILHLGLIIFLIVLSLYYVTKGYGNGEGSVFSGFGAMVLIGILIGAWSSSYNSYVELREYKDGLVLQHDLKALSAVSQTTNNDDNLIAETKDGYYEGLVNGIYEAKNRINDYNTKIINKRLYGNNFFFGLYVILPDDDMILIGVSDYDFNIGKE